MEHRTKRDHPWVNLIAEYESMNSNGEIIYLEERDFLRLIDYYEDEYQIEKAIEVADYAINQHPYCIDFLLISARLLLVCDKPFRSLHILDKAEAISPCEMDVFLLKARSFSILGEPEDARKQLKAAKKLAMGANDKLEVYLCEAAVYENIKDYDSMFKALSKALILNPSNEEALERIWISVELSRRYKDSVKLHKKLLEVDTFLYQAWFNLGHAYACLGEYHKAINAIEYSFLINPEFELGYLDCAELCCQEKMFDRALDIYQEMVERFGSDSEDLVKIAECQIETNQIESGEESLVSALRLDPYNDEVYYYLAKCFSIQGRLENAQSALIKAIELEDRREEYYSDLAQIYARTEDIGKADFYFRKATEIGPEQDFYWILHCKFLMGIGEFEKALEVIEEADYHTFSAELMYCKSVCLLKLDFRRKAFKVLSEALVEEFDSHKIIFEICPDLKDDEEVVSIVKYYEGEFVQTL